MRRWLFHLRILFKSCVFSLAQRKQAFLLSKYKHLKILEVHIQLQQKLTSNNWILCLRCPLNYLPNTEGFVVGFTPFMKKTFGGKVLFLLSCSERAWGEIHPKHTSPVLPFSRCLPGRAASLPQHAGEEWWMRPTSTAQTPQGKPIPSARLIPHSRKPTCQDLPSHASSHFHPWSNPSGPGGAHPRKRWYSGSAGSAHRNKSCFCFVPLQKLQPVSRELVTDRTLAWAVPTTSQK